MSVISFKKEENKILSRVTHDHQGALVPGIIYIYDAVSSYSSGSLKYIVMVKVIDILPHITS